MCAMETHGYTNAERETPLISGIGRKSEKSIDPPLSLSAPYPTFPAGRGHCCDKSNLENTATSASPTAIRLLANGSNTTSILKTPSYAGEFQHFQVENSHSLGQRSLERRASGNSRGRNERYLLSLDNSISECPETQVLRNADESTRQKSKHPSITSPDNSDSLRGFNMSPESLNTIGTYDIPAEFPLSANNKFSDIIGDKARGKSHVNTVSNTRCSTQIDANISLHSGSSRRHVPSILLSHHNSLAGKSPLIHGNNWLSHYCSAFTHNVDELVCKNPKSPLQFTKPSIPGSLGVSKIPSLVELQTCKGLNHVTHPFHSKQERLEVDLNAPLNKTTSPSAKSSFHKKALSKRMGVNKSTDSNFGGVKGVKFLNPNLSVQRQEQVRRTEEYCEKNMYAEISLEQPHAAFEYGTDLSVDDAPNDSVDDARQSLSHHYEFDSNSSEENGFSRKNGEKSIEYNLMSLNLDIDDEGRPSRLHLDTKFSPKDTLHRFNVSQNLPSRRSHRSANMRIDTRYIHDDSFNSNEVIFDNAASAWQNTAYATGGGGLDSSNIIESSMINNIAVDMDNNGASPLTALNSNVFSPDILPMTLSVPTASACYRNSTEENEDILRSPARCRISGLKSGEAVSVARYDKFDQTTEAGENTNTFPFLRNQYGFRPFSAFEYGQLPNVSPSRFNLKPGHVCVPVTSGLLPSSPRLHNEFDLPPTNNSLSVAPPVNDGVYFNSQRIPVKFKDTFPSFPSEAEQYLGDYYDKDRMAVHSAVEFRSNLADPEGWGYHGYHPYTQRPCGVQGTSRSLRSRTVQPQSASSHEYNSSGNNCLRPTSWISSVGAPIKVKPNVGFAKPASQNVTPREEANKNPLLEELKICKNAKIELRSILGSTVEFSCDQYGSRFIQQKIQSATATERQAVFEEILPNALQLMTDVFGNYVIQKFFEYGTHKQRELLAKKMEGNVLSLSLHMYGCRVAQKALECVSHDQQTALVRELEGNVIRCIKDQNGNHVIQKAIELVPAEHIEFIINAFVGQIVNLATHPYGCRVVQRAIQHLYDKGDTDEVSEMDEISGIGQRRRCKDIWKSVKKPILNELLMNTISLIQDQYGNYVVQHVLEKGGPAEKSLITKKVCTLVLQLSRHKFASNVVEKCVTYGSKEDKELLVDEVLKTRIDGTCPLVTMMKDQFANYVVQKMLEVSEEKQREEFTNKIKPHLQFLKKYSYGRHLTAKVEKIISAQNADSDNNTS